MTRTSMLAGWAALVIACHDDASSDEASTTDAPGSTSGSSSSTSNATSSDDAPDDDTSSSSGDSGGSSSSEGPAPLPECPVFAAGVAAGTVGGDELVEISGISASRTHPGVFWVHNDSGDGPRVFAIGTLGATLAELELDGAFAFDWEDIALGPGPEPGVDYLYLGDIGDNPELRANVTVYRVPEPDPDLGDGTLTDVVPLTLDYADGPHNAETLLVDPVTGDLAIVTKSERGSTVWRAAAPLDDGATIVLEPIAELPFGSATLPGSPLATGGDIGPSGSLIAIRTYDAVFGWRRTPGAALADAFATEPCPLPMVDEDQGEAITVLDDAYITVSEGEMPTLWRFDAQ